MVHLPWLLSFPRAFVLAPRTSPFVLPGLNLTVVGGLGHRLFRAAFWAPEPPAPQGWLDREVLPTLFGADQRVARFPRDVQTHARFLLRGRAGALMHLVLGQRRHADGPRRWRLSRRSPESPASRST